MDLRDRVGPFQLAYCRPQHAAADQQQQYAQSQGRRGLVAIMPVVMVRIGFFLTMPVGHQHDKVGY
ncbi:hypothetical protein D3C72_2538170 [compost metagenome]